MDTKIRMNLRLFDGGAAAGASGGGTAEGSAGSNAGVADQNSKQPEKVVYGIQDAEVTEETTQATTNEAPKTKSEPADKGKAFEDMIKGDYKEQFDARVKQILDRRFKGHDELAKFKADSQEIFDLMYAKYGVDNLDSLRKAVQADDSYFEEAAAEEGLTIEQYKYKQKLERENAQLKQAEAEAARVRQANQTMAQWKQEAESLKTRYPNFDLDTEARANPKFVRLLQSGIDVKTAYETVHHDEILSGAMMQTAQAVRENVTNSIKARGLRPSENGINAQAGVIVKNDVSKLTPKDRAEIARQARMGKTIRF